MTYEELMVANEIKRKIAELEIGIAKAENIEGDDLEELTVRELYYAIDLANSPFLMTEAVKFLRSALKLMKAERDRLQKTFEEL